MVKLLSGGSAGVMSAPVIRITFQRFFFFLVFPGGIFGPWIPVTHERIKLN